MFSLQHLQTMQCETNPYLCLSDTLLLVLASVGGLFFTCSPIRCVIAAADCLVRINAHPTVLATSIARCASMRALSCCRGAIYGDLDAASPAGIPA